MIKCSLCGEEFETNKELTKHLVGSHSFSLNQIYEYYEFDFSKDQQICPICGNMFTLSRRQILKYEKGLEPCIGCSSACSKAFVHIIHGSPLSKAEVREKIRETSLERYGTEQVLSSREVREKIKKTSLERYGVSHAPASKEVREKIESTNMERYGVKSTLSNEEVKRKIEATNLEKYGTEKIGKSKKVRDKIKNTNLKKYGVESAFASPIIRDKIKETNLERYGVGNPAKSVEVREKFRETCLNKFEAFSPLESPEILEKIKATNLERYGVESIGSIPEVHERASKTMLERYGVEFFCQHERCNVEAGKRISKLNRKFSSFLLENNIDNELEYIIEGSGFDLRVGNILIEIDPTYTHNSTIGPFLFGGEQKDPKPENYHSEKTKKAVDHNFRCIHVFDWDSWDKVLNLLTTKETIYARNCKIRKISKKEADRFLNAFHLQGSTKSCPVAYGLFFKEELVQIMTFGRPRYAKKYEWELLRLCSHKRYKIVGGSNRLLKHFEKEFSPQSLISYCDLSKFTGETYKSLGFTLGNISLPARHWYCPKTKQHITDNLLRQRGFDQLHGTSYGKGTSNEALMLDHGYLEVYDCGQAKYVKITNS